LKHWMIVPACVLVCGAAALGGWRMLSGARGAVEPSSTAKALPALPVAALGRIEPQSEIINLGAGVSPERLDSLSVARGDLVTRGQVLGYLGGYAQQIAERDVYNTQLTEARQKLATEIALGAARIEDAENRQKQVDEVQPLRIAAQEATLASLEAALANDQEILKAQLELSEKGATTVRLRDNQQTQVLRDQADINVARARLAELKRQFELDRISAATQLRLAKANSERSKSDIPVASLERQVELANARAHKLTLVAPIDGRVLNVLVKPGEQIGNGPILTMGDTTVMRAVAEVYETDIGRVLIGQRATVTSRALRQPVAGKVVRIGDMVFKNDVLNVDPAARADARVVEVWIELDDAASTERLTNLTVDVLIAPAAPPAATAAAP
jgi:HlyD family secretion protein